MPDCRQCLIEYLKCTKRNAVSAECWHAFRQCQRECIATQTPAEEPVLMFDAITRLRSAQTSR